MTVKILILDDEWAIVGHYKNQLFKNFKNIEIETFIDSRDVVKKIRDGNFNYDIAIIDNGMPHHDGIYIAEQMKNINPNIYIILVSVMSYCKLVKRYKYLFDYQIEKPISYELFISVVKEVINKIEIRNNILNNEEYKIKDRLLIKNMINDILSDEEKNEITYQSIINNTNISENTVKRTLSRIFDSELKEELNEKTNIGCIRKIIKLLRGEKF